MDVADLRPISLFDGLRDDQLRELVAAGHEVPVEPGVDLFHEGEHADFWWVLVDGALDLVRHLGREETVVGRMDVPGRWAGGFRAWDQHGVYLATGRGIRAGRVLRVPADVLRERSIVWFPFVGHLIEGLYGTARRIEATARQSDSLVTLGTLAAGLAHEINNPAAAATRAVDALEDVCRTLLSSLTRLADEQISPDQFSALDRLRRDVTPPAGVRDALDVADQEEQLSAWLSDHGVDRDWLIAPPLAAGGVDTDWCERAGALLEGPALEPGLEWVASTFAAVSLLGEVKESTRRISELVGAVRAYSQMDRASLQLSDVTEGLESTLVMLGHRLRDGGVTVVRHYGSAVPRIQAYAGELNQVWTNLISNAVDAMQSSGTLTVTTRVDTDTDTDTDAVVVEVEDDGVGMSAEVAGRAFEAFYTTKDVGTGTGLGLDIARRIVEERHGGTLRIDSRPGRTVLEVRLPLRSPAAG
jgi:signal transduction histidine kinase